MQDVPITIQALTAESLAELHVSTFDDFVRYLPNVTQASNGPGQSNIFMRGLSAEAGGPGGGGSQGSGTTGQFPNVAVYLDEQSASLPGRNLDIYAADLERIEVLEGPQGTLFGSGAQAGMLRYITNKPKLGVTEGNVNAGYSYTAQGQPNSNVDAMINLPLIADTLAVRGVIYNDHRGGYIDNVPSTFTRSGTDLGLTRYNGGVVPNTSLSINNNNIVANDINPVTYTGIRVSGLYKINDDWDVLLTQSYQNMDAQGVFSEMPFASDGVTFNSQYVPVGSRALPPLSVTLFNPSFDKDKFENTSLTVTGKLGPLKAVYSGGYLVRNVEQVQDYTNYARGVFGYYYQCAGYSKTSAAAGQCYTPSTTWHEAEKNTHQSHELRVSTPDDWRIRAIAGAYWEEFKIFDDTNWLYKTVPTCSSTSDTYCFNNVQPWPGVPANNPNVRNDNTGFFDDVVRTVRQTAAFASVDVDLIPKTLTLTAGTRYYRFLEDERGGDVGSFYCKTGATPTTYFGPCLTPYGTNLDLQNPNRSKYTGFRSRANLSWKVTDDILLYYTWSQGFRPGGFNRGVSAHLPEANGVSQFSTPATYAPDQLTNNEFGWKTEWWAHRMQFNGALYQESWKNAQVAFFDPQGGFGNLTFSTNGPDFRVRGIEIQFVGRVWEGLTLTGSAAWNSGEQTNSPFLINNNPKSPTYGQPITSVPNPYGSAGSPLANSPPFAANLRARYEFTFNDYQAFFQVGGTHQGNSYSATGNVPKYDQPGYTLYDASAGVAKGAWTVQAFSQNLTNVLASTFTNSPQWIEQEAVTRPRTAGIKFSCKF
jgi:outer membrane receptor protein involved in Fe transport